MWIIQTFDGEDPPLEDNWVKKLYKSVSIHIKVEHVFNHFLPFKRKRARAVFKSTNVYFNMIKFSNYKRKNRRSREIFMDKFLIVTN